MHEGEMTSHDGAELQMRSGVGNRNGLTQLLLYWYKWHCQLPPATTSKLW